MTSPLFSYPHYAFVNWISNQPSSFISLHGAISLCLLPDGLLLLCIPISYSVSQPSSRVLWPCIKTCSFWIILPTQIASFPIQSSAHQIMMLDLVSTDLSIPPSSSLRASFSEPAQALSLDSRGFRSGGDLRASLAQDSLFIWRHWGWVRGWGCRQRTVLALLFYPVSMCCMCKHRYILTRFLSIWWHFCNLTQANDSNDRNFRVGRQECLS